MVLTLREFKTHCKSVLVITVYGFFLQIYTLPLHTRNIQLITLAQTTSIMPKTRRNAYDAAFKLKAIELAIEKGNRAAAYELGVNESMIRRWRKQRGELSRCKKSTKAFRGRKCRWPELEDELDWVNTQRVDGQGVSTVQIRLKARSITFCG